MIIFVPGVWPTTNQILSLVRAAGWRARDGKLRGRGHRGATACDDARRAFQAAVRAAFNGHDLPQPPYRVVCELRHPSRVDPDAGALLAKWALDEIFGARADGPVAVAALELRAQAKAGMPWLSVSVENTTKEVTP